MKNYSFMEIRSYILGMFFCLVPFLVVAQDFPNNDSYDLARLHSGIKTKRVSSYDQTGGNSDRMVNIKPGEKRVIFDVKGAGVINHIWFTISPDPKGINRNDIILRMFWDNKDYPSVESPIGPFFGQGWNEQYNFVSQLLATGPKNGTGLVSYFTMPFADGARIEVENQADVPIKALYFYVDYMEMKKLPDNMGRFHAWYNTELTEANGEKKGNLDGKKNYLIADITGKGKFIGVNYYVQNPYVGWYGEGDDMWYIDGEEIPSMIGTGTEDFFNTSWCPNEVYMHPYYGYPRVNNNIGWLGRTHLYRFFIQDPVYFDKSLKLNIEHGHDNDKTLELTSVAYWYQEKAAKIPSLLQKNERVIKPLIDLRQIDGWRKSWVKEKGNVDNLWGNEK